MTPRQRAWYFRSWSRAAHALGWIMRRGRLQAGLTPPPETPGERARLLRVVWAAAVARARRHGRAPTADDLRHGCHIAAVGHDVSSLRLSNEQLDRVIALFDLLAREDDLRAMCRWIDPDHDARRRREHWIAHRCDPRYVAAIARDRFGVSDWTVLDDEQLAMLHRLLRQRPNARRQPIEDPF